MADNDALIKRTQLKRNAFTPIGEVKTESVPSSSSSADATSAAPQELDGVVEEYDEEIFDDTDFYQHLLREIITSGLGRLLSHLFSFCLFVCCHLIRSIFYSRVQCK
jgi:hypothetical protein